MTEAGIARPARRPVRRTVGRLAYRQATAWLVWLFILGNGAELPLDVRATGGGRAGDRRDPGVHMPGALDPSGLVKGRSVERGGTILETQGAADYSANAGGDIRTRGAALPAPTWRIGIQHPQHGDTVAAVVEANDLAIATADAYATAVFTRSRVKIGRSSGSP